MPGGNLADRLAVLGAPATGDDGEVTVTVAGSGVVTMDILTGQAPQPDGPAMPVMPFPTFHNVPTLPQQSPGGGHQSGRDSRAR